MLMKVIGVVRLSRDVEFRYTQSGSAVASFAVASSKKYKTKAGEQKKDTTFIDCVAFSGLAEICNKYLKKGSLVYIVGELKLEQWTAQDGSKRSRHSVTVESMKMLDSKSDNSQTTQQQGGGYQSNNGQTNAPQEASIPEIDIDEGSIPF